MKYRYKDFNTWLRGIFGQRVQKITVDAGLNCPNRDGTVGRGGCIYCNARGSGTGDFTRGRTVSGQIRINAEFIARKYKAKKFLVYFQSFSNTYAPAEKLESLYKEALQSIEGVVGLCIGTRPDCVNREVLDLLQSYTEKYLIWLEYGLQTVHDTTLALINRGHDFACFQRAVEMTRNRGIRICAHVILGLPGETREQMMQTARTVAGLGIDGIKIHLLYVVRGTKLDEMYQNGLYHPLAQAEYADMVCEFLEYLPPNMVIQRLTGDPHREEIAAPEWSLDKKGTLRMIAEALEKQDTWQGKKYNSLK